MLLTKDNLVKFVREKKYVTPTIIAESFETTTMIGSAALSELSQSKIVAISNIKIGSTPYYYDPLQKQCLIELGEKHLSGHEKEVFQKLKQHEIVNDNLLSIQEKLAMEKIKDFASPLEVQHHERLFKFWVWYLRDLNETKKLIIEALNPKKEVVQKEEVLEKKEKVVRPMTNMHQESKITTSSRVVEQQHRAQPIMEQRQVLNNRYSQSQNNKSINESNGENLEEENFSDETSMQVKQEKSEPQITLPKREFKPMNGGENQVEHFIEKYLFENNLKIENKNKTEKGILYSTLLKGTNLQIHIDCFYFTKKPTEGDLIFFYTSSMKPKIVFIENAPPKLFKLVENIQNMTLVNI